MILLEFHLRDTKTGRIGTHDYDYEDNYPTDAIEFMWEEGNFACDCNRSQFLYGDDLTECYNCSSEDIELDKVTIKDTGQVVFDGSEWSWPKGWVKES